MTFDFNEEKYKSEIKFNEQTEKNAIYDTKNKDFFGATTLSDLFTQQKTFYDSDLYKKITLFRKDFLFPKLFSFHIFEKIFNKESSKYIESNY